MAKLKTGRHTSAIKAVRQSEKRAAVNRGVKNRIHEKVKEFKKLLAQKDISNASKMAPEIYSLLDKVAKKGTVHWKNSSRNKSRLSELLKKTINNPK
ncbi:MAG: 30S ribosomal protein S20 [Elusimicrobia bacterium CG08_land_8_20_14_0_20_51_18]|nr:MAG: 30S ribosomal protein S20 [Elusimicrobia bacterium CG08_land_8_20_14_0_20_51_18]